MKNITSQIWIALFSIFLLTSDGNSQARNQMFIGARPLGLSETFVAIADDGNAA